MIKHLLPLIIITLFCEGDSAHAPIPLSCVTYYADVEKFCSSGRLGAGVIEELEKPDSPRLLGRAYRKIKNTLKTLH